MIDQLIIVYGTRWCGDCVRVRYYLDKNQIPYQWINIDTDKQGEKRVLSLNAGMRSVPTIIFPDGSYLVEPSELLLSRKIKEFLP